MKRFMAGLAIVAVLFAAGCASTDTKTGAAYSVRELAVQGNRNNEIPAILTIPGGEGPHPVVLIAHGHGGSKSENGGFDLLAAELAKQGLASLRMDFAGCGDNTEDFTQANRLSYMIDDVAACKAYLGTVAEADLSRLGILGYSMGGRIAVVTAGRDPDYKAVVLWSPAILPGAADLYAFMQLSGEADFMALYEKARADGAATYTNAFGATQTLGLGWFEDMLGIDPPAEFSGFTGELLLITGSKDDIVPTDNALQITTAPSAAKNIQWQEIEGADHGYGIYSGETRLTEQTVKASVDFFGALR